MVKSHSAKQAEKLRIQRRRDEAERGLRRGSLTKNFSGSVQRQGKGGKTVGSKNPFQPHEREVGLLLEKMRRFELDAAMQIARGIARRPLLLVKQTAVLIQTIALRMPMDFALELLNILYSTTDFANQGEAAYFYRYTRWAVMELLAESAGAIERTRHIQAETLERHGMCCARMLGQKAAGHIEMNMHGRLPNDHIFKRGDSVLITTQGHTLGDASVEAEIVTNPGLCGMICRIVGVQRDQLQAYFGHTFRVDKVANRIAFTRQLDAIKQLCLHQGIPNPFQKILVAECSQPKEEREAEIDLCKEEVNHITNRGGEAEFQELNESQQIAVSKALVRRFTLIQGPPGTGKTHTASRIVQGWVKNDSWATVLASADSNIAVDNLLTKCVELGLNCVRVGRPENSRVDLCKYMLENLVKAETGVSEQELNQRQKESNWKIENAILKKAEVVFATCCGAASGVLEKINFSHIIIDEAAQATELSTLVPLFGNGIKQACLIGDHRQLPPTVICRDAELEGLNVSLFDRLVKRGVEVTMLETQYRMHPTLAEFANREYYGNRLKNGITEEDRPLPEGFNWPAPEKGPVAMVCIRGQEQPEGTSYVNISEQVAIQNVVLKMLEAGDVQEKDIGIITPYAAQARAIRRLLKASRPNHRKIQEDYAATERVEEERIEVEVSSVDGFQGREKDLIIVSTVRANPMGAVGFLCDPRRLNVTITRAKRGMIVFGDGVTLQGDEQGWGAWIAWARMNNFVIGGDSLPPLQAKQQERLMMMGAPQIQPFCFIPPGAALTIPHHAYAPHIPFYQQLSYQQQYTQAWGGESSSGGGKHARREENAGGGKRPREGTDLYGYPEDEEAAGGGSRAQESGNGSGNPFNDFSTFQFPSEKSDIKVKEEQISHESNQSGLHTRFRSKNEKDSGNTRNTRNSPPGWGRNTRNIARVTEEPSDTHYGTNAPTHSSRFSTFEFPPDSSTASTNEKKKEGDDYLCDEGNDRPAWHWTRQNKAGRKNDEGDKRVKQEWGGSSSGSGGGSQWWRSGKGGGDWSSSSWWGPPSKGASHWKGK